MILPDLTARFQSWPAAALSIALLAVSVVLALVALLPGHELVKALILAWVIFP